MKRMVMLISLSVFLAGCSSASLPLNQAMQFRDGLLSAAGCSFSAEVTADYGDELYTFTMDCQGDSAGDLTFAVTSPEEISGISGTISDSGGTLTFEETALHFDLLTDDQLSPVSAPWVFLRTLRSGCITSACMEGELLRVTADDSYEDDALTLDIRLDGENRPIHADILYDGKRILSVKVDSFVLL